ncbi:MAG: hypothetical protein ACTHOB_07115 [Ginsengibacter sp.]
MESKFVTLRAVYEIVKGASDPTKTLLSINELILRQPLAWDEVVQHLRDLDMEGYILLQQLSVAVISITGKGIECAQLNNQNHLDPLRNLKYSL